MKHLLKLIAAAALLSAPAFSQNTGDWTADYTEDTSFAGTEVFTFQNPGPLQRRATFNDMADDISIYMNAPTFGDGTAATIVFNFDLLAGDHTLTAGNGVVALTGGLTVDGPSTFNNTVDLDGNNLDNVGTLTATTLNVTDFNADYLLIGEKAASTTVAAGNGEVWVENTAPTSLKFTDDTDTDHTVVLAGQETDVWIIACSDETTDLTTGTAKVTFRAPYAATVTGVKASLTTAATGANLVTVDINEAGVSILSTLITLDASETTSTTAATAPVISDSAIADDAEITIDLDQIGNTTAGQGLKVYITHTH